MTRRIAIIWRMAAAVLLAVLLALQPAISAYASGFSLYQSNHIGADLQSLASFVWVESNDNGQVGYPHGYPQGVDPGDNGNDPGQPQTDGVALPVSARYAANTANTTAIFTPNSITITVNNAYPGYCPTVFFGLTNQASVPGTVQSIIITHPPEISITLNGIRENDQIKAGEVVTGALSISLDQSIQQDTSYAVSLSIEVEQWFPTTSSSGPVPTPVISPTATNSVPPTSTSATPSTQIRIVELTVPQANSQAGITVDGVVTDTLSATTPDDSFSLIITSGTTMNISNENRPNPIDLSLIGTTVPAKIEVTNPDLNSIPTLPDGWIAVSQPYDINAVTNGYVTGVQLDRPATLIIKYDTNKLPATVDDLAIFYYSYQGGWRQLNAPSGSIAEGPEVAAEVDHFSLFIVLAKTGQGSPPADIVIQKLTLDPPRIMVGQSSNVRINITNKGGMTGEYVVTVKVDGKVQKTQSVFLGPGESKEIYLTLTPGQSGSYTVTAGPASSNLIVTSRIVAATALANQWWVWLFLGIAILVFLVFCFIFIILRLWPVYRRRTFRLEMPQISASSGITRRGIVTSPLAATTPDSHFSLRIEKGTRIKITESNPHTKENLSRIVSTVPDRIEVTIPSKGTLPHLETIPSLPDGWIAASLPYDIHGVTDGVAHEIKLNKPARLIIKYDMKEMSPCIDGPAIFCHDSQRGWVRLEPLPDFISQGSEIAVETNHFSLFIILIKTE